MERGIEEGMEKVQNYILDLIGQGLSGEEIKNKIAAKKFSFKIVTSAKKS